MVLSVCAFDVLHAAPIAPSAPPAAPIPSSSPSVQAQLKTTFSVQMITYLFGTTVLFVHAEHANPNWCSTPCASASMVLSTFSIWPAFTAVPPKRTILSSSAHGSIKTELRGLKPHTATEIVHHNYYSGPITHIFVKQCIALGRSEAGHVNWQDDNSN